MRDEEELREKLESFGEGHEVVYPEMEEIGIDPGNNPEQGAVYKTLQWVLEEDED